FLAILPTPHPAFGKVINDAADFLLASHPAIFGSIANPIKTGSLDAYAKAYARPGGMRAGFEYFRAFEKDAEDFARLAQTPLPMPMLVMTGEKASGEFLIEQG